MADNPAFEADDIRQRNTEGVISNKHQHEAQVVTVEDQEQTMKTPTTEQLGLLYSISDIPPWYLCIFLGLQHFLLAVGSILSISLVLMPSLCLKFDDVGIAEIFSTALFVYGLNTAMQATFGVRLPILQGTSAAFLAPAFAILRLPKWQCPDMSELDNITLGNETNIEDYKTEVWQSRMREEYVRYNYQLLSSIPIGITQIQGAVMLASLFQMFIGMTGLLGMLLRFIGPLSIAPTIALVGISLFQPAANACQGQWWIALATMICIIVISQFLSKCGIPCYAVKNKPSGDKGCIKARTLPFFQLFPVLLALLLMWLICYILTVTDTLPADSTKWGFAARTDARIAILQKAKWFRFPYPFQWGIPTFSAAGVFGMLAGVLAGIVESLGDYHACARLTGAPPPPEHAVNRGVMIEGLGCLFAGMWGTSSGTTSFSQNVGSIGITRVGSRVVVQTSGLIMLMLGMIGKFGAFFVTIPQPVIGGVIMVTFGMIVSVGISNLQYCNMNSPRNLMIVGFALFFGISLPNWISSHPSVIKTGSAVVDQIFTVLLSTSMFVGGIVGFIMDNTIPGTEEERGIRAWRNSLRGASKETMKINLEDDSYRCYDLPWCMGCIHKGTCFKYVPFCPTFDYSPSCSCRKTSFNHEIESISVNDIEYSKNAMDMKIEEDDTGPYIPQKTHL